MATTLTVNAVTANMQWTLQNTPAGLNPISSQNQVNYSSGGLTNGTGAAGTANLVYAVQSVIAASGTLTITFSSAGSLKDQFGGATTFARLKFLFVNNTNLTASTGISIGNASQPLPIFSAGSATLTINNNGVFLTGDPGAAGIAVGLGATDQLLATNLDGSHSATVMIVAIGSTA